ncbi:MAG: hypothetical protein DI549_18540 [Ancylobacter novellus]|uniref:Uncharacterized protein n=1 Tax=Ancylobacter novellus TaxID=921 RepID=A0A2W5QMU0_ANCNO|nr:MAG: hypothetical protein DI549_18540 [Ancylobacter novellus]
MAESCGPGKTRMGGRAVFGRPCLTDGNRKELRALSRQNASHSYARRTIMPAILMWLIGIPIPIIILLYLIT